MERWLRWPRCRRSCPHFDRWKFKHQKPIDFFDVSTEVLGRNIRWYFDQVYRSSNVFGTASELKSTRDEDNRTSVVVRRPGEAVSIDVLVTFKNGERVQALGRQRSLEAIQV